MHVSPYAAIYTTSPLTVLLVHLVRHKLAVVTHYDRLPQWTLESLV